MTFRLLAAVLLWLPFQIAADTLYWTAGTNQLEVAHKVDYWAESEPGITIAQVRALEDGAWTRNRSDSVSLGYGDQVYWFRMRVDNVTGLPVPALLEIAYPVLDHIGLYLVWGGQVSETWQLGDKLPFHQRPLDHRNFVVPVDLPAGEPVTLYLRVDTTSSMQVPMMLWQRDQFFAAEQVRNLFEGLYFGIVLAMILYNLFVFKAVGERNFLYYVGYIAAMPLFLASLHGLSFQFFWPNATWWNDQSIIFFLNLTVTFGGIFAIRFLTVLPSNHPVLNRVTLVVVAASLLQALMALVLPYQTLILPTIVLAFIGCSMMLLLSVVRWFKRDVAARYYTVAWVCMLFGGIVLALSKFTVLPRNLLTENATQVGSAVGVILLSIALADRLNKEKKTAFQAQQRLLLEERKARAAQEQSLTVQREANTLLEQRVRERTQDLEALNQQLLELNSTDALTALKNRGHFDRAFQSACVKAYRFGQPLALLVLDIDHFKKFNDTYGHLVGDDCLQMVAQGIRNHVTRPQDLAARYGGEEFVVLLPDTPADGAVQVAERIRREIEGTDFRVSDEVLRLTVSVGVCASRPDHADQTKDIFRFADEALYEAKGAGRNRVVLSHRPSVRSRAEVSA